ncbi:hypothetical protein K432DRAFT_71142 [Lepidopterella palustris CBS 459.81]|uniref:Uncharacterized protein n=1 Tax=Lepidopterella palustris CBS 459.81 TaxID=1314670 RepID=A0A8E2E8Y7_9PEZI|nr:hypothetical protein K432DRAFT_71142 [Lepidopterella palustris CBS 459.81]
MLQPCLQDRHTVDTSLASMRLTVFDIGSGFTRRLYWKHIQKTDGEQPPRVPRGASTPTPSSGRPLLHTLHFFLRLPVQMCPGALVQVFKDGCWCPGAGVVGQSLESPQSKSQFLSRNHLGKTTHPAGERLQAHQRTSLTRAECKNALPLGDQRSKTHFESPRDAVTTS